MIKLENPLDEYQSMLFHDVTTRLLVIGSAVKFYLDKENDVLFKKPLSSFYSETLNYTRYKTDNIALQKHASIMNFSQFCTDYPDYLAFSAGWLANSEKDIDSVLYLGGFSGIDYMCSKLCASAIYKARKGCTKREIYEFVREEYRKFMRRKYGQFNYSLNDIPASITHADNFVEWYMRALLGFFEDEPTDIWNLKYDIIRWGLNVAYYGMNPTFQRCIFDGLPKSKHQGFFYDLEMVFDTIVKHKPSQRGKSDDEQWLKEYYEQCANRERTKLDEVPVEKDMPKWLLFLTAPFAVLLMMGSSRDSSGSGVAPWSIIVYIALMLAVSIMEFNWLGWIFITLFFMSFVWKGGE